MHERAGVLVWPVDVYTGDGVLVWPVDVYAGDGARACMSARVCWCGL